MSYRTGENVIDHSYCESDLIRSAKSNVNFFIEVIIGLAVGIGLIGLLGSTLLGMLSCFGGCLGCEACLETAACADETMEEMGCEDCSDDYYDDVGCWEEITEENLEMANECATCEGIDCFGRQGCFASDGCGDCEDCMGEMYYSITLVVGDTSKTLEIHESQTRLEIYYPSGVDASYYNFKGYYDKDGNQYVNSSGVIVKMLRNNLTLYGRYEEYGVGNEYTFNLILSELGEHNKTVVLSVGDPISTQLIPIAPEKEGYEFVGWYLNGQLVHKGNIEDGEIFHLYTFGLNLYSSEGPHELTARYAVKTYTITLMYNNYPYEYTAQYGSTYGDIYSRFYWNINDLTYDERFFGWGPEATSAPEEKLKDDATIVSNVTLYAIFRDPVYVSFYNNRSMSDSAYFNVKFYEGQSNILFETVDELQYTMTNESANPGYKFVGWYASRYPSGDEQAVNGITMVNKYSTYVYYAMWETTDYAIDYYAMNYESGVLEHIDTDKYYYSSSTVTLKPAEEVMRNFGYEFVGWCFTEDYSDSPVAYLPSYTYGTKKAYAKYEPKKFEYSWFANGGTVYGDYDGMDTITYGQGNQLPIPTREGYNFLGWQLDGTDIFVGDTNAYVDKFTFGTIGLENTLASENKVADEGFLLRAQWEIKKFNITFVSDGKTYNEQVINWGDNVIEPDQPVKKGYTFRYWVNENGDQFYFSTDIKKDWTLTAYFEINRYTVVFYVDDRANVAENVTHGMTLSQALGKVESWCPAYYEKEQRRIIGWFDSMSDSAVQYDNDFTIELNAMDDEIFIYAHFELARVFTFVNATNGETKYFFVNERYAFPESAKEGYTFLGWSTSEYSSTPMVSAGGDMYILESTGTTWYPIFETIKYTITYYYGNTVFMTDTYTIEDTKYLLSGGEAPSKTGYTFVGWVVDSDGDYDYTDEVKSYITQLTNSTGNKKYLAAFEANDYTVILTTNNGIEYVTVTYDQPFNFGVAPSKEGYDFEGWAWREYNADDTNKEIVTYATGASKGVYNIANDTNAYPVYTRTPYTFTWYVDGSVASTTQQKHFDTRVSKPTDPIKEGYTFVGWYKDSGLTQEYDFYHEVTGPESIYAKFTINTYSVTFTVGGTQKKTVTLTYNESLASAINDAQQYANAYATEKVAVFKGWRDKYTGNYCDASSRVPARNVELVAVFDMPIYITFNANGGVLTGYGNQASMTTQAYHDSITLTPPTASRTGYTFLGWFKNNNESDKAGSTITVNGNENNQTNVTYVARWKANTYTVYYYLGGVYQKYEQYTMDQTEVSGGFKLWDGGVGKGQKLTGWYTNNSYSGAEIKEIDNSKDGTKTAGDLYLYGKIENQTYSIIIKDKDGTQFKTLSVTYGQSLSAVDTSWVVSYAAGNTNFAGFVQEGTNKVYLNNKGEWRNVSTYDWDSDLVLVAKFY